MSLWPTAGVHLIRRNKQVHNLRALIDTRAHIYAVTTKASKTLGLEPNRSNEGIILVNQKDTMPIDGSLEVEIIPNIGKSYFQLRSAEDN